MKREQLELAIGEEIDNHGQVQYWIGMELGHRGYKLEIKDTNDFIKRYLVK